MAGARCGLGFVATWRQMELAAVFMAPRATTKGAQPFWRATAGPMGPSVVQLTPEQQYEARKAERERLKAMDLQTRERTSMAMMLEMLDRFVTAVERMTEQHHSAPRGCVCPPGAEATCKGVSCPRR